MTATEAREMAAYLRSREVDSDLVRAGKLGRATGAIDCAMRKRTIKEVRDYLLPILMDLEADESVWRVRMKGEDEKRALEYDAIAERLEAQEAA